MTEAGGGGSVEEFSTIMAVRWRRGVGRAGPSYQFPAPADARGRGVSAGPPAPRSSLNRGTAPPPSVEDRSVVLTYSRSPEDVVVLIGYRPARFGYIDRLEVEDFP